MELESDIQQDILFSKLNASLQKSNSTLHKKALVLVKELKGRMVPSSSTGLDGLKQYTKLIIDLILKLLGNFSSEEDISNYEALVFTLAVCLKQLPFGSLRNPNLLSRVENIVKFSLNREFEHNYPILKYTIIILERILYSRNDNELANEKDEVVQFYVNNYFIILSRTFKSSEISQNLQKDLIKSVCKIIRDKVNSIRFTVLKSIIDDIQSRLDKMKGNFEQEADGKKIISAVSQNEGESVLKFLSSVIQFFPFEIVNDKIFAVYDLIEHVNSVQILMNCFLCIDVAFSTKKFALETGEQFLKLLLNKKIMLLEGAISSDTRDKFIVSYIKSTTQVLISISNINYLQSMKYFIVILNIFSEFIIEGNDFVKGSIFNSLQNIINKLLSKDNLNKLFGINKKEEIELGNMNLEGGMKIDGDFILEKSAKALLYMLSSRFSDNKIGYNLLLTFVEKINSCNYSNHIEPINEHIIFTLSEQEHKSEMMKIFIGKSFNFIPCKIIIKYFPLGILDYDIAKDDYTESSNVWIISFMDKFLKEGAQSISDFVECFMNTINELEYMISKLIKNSGEDQNMEEDDDNDERLEVDQRDTKHIREVKIKRYKLILTQMMSQIIKFTNFCQDYHKYIESFLIKFQQYYENEGTCYFQGLNHITFRFLYKIMTNIGKKNDLQSTEVMKNLGLYFFQKILNMMLSNKFTSKSELQEGFNVVTKFCLILTEGRLQKIILDMIERFDKVVNSDVWGKAQSEKAKQKEINKLIMRLEIINYMLKNITINITKPEQNSTNSLSMVLFEFFEKYFFTYASSKNSNQENISKKLFDIFLTILSKITDTSYSYEIIKNFERKKGLNLITQKQQAKIFEIFTDLIIKQFSNKQFSFDEFKSNLGFMSSIALLTKDQNKKVRNMSYEIIGNITKFLTEKGVFIEWVKLLITLIVDKESSINSAGINSLARAFWENRNEPSIVKCLIETSDAVLLHFKSNNKEILKSLFIYIRVLLFILKNSQVENKEDLINKTIFTSLDGLTETVQKEFKVKIRNLLKNAILNFGFEKVKNCVPEKYKQLVQYVNKHLVKKIKDVERDEENLHGYNREDLDNTVMMDNEENLIDEEEDYIKKEFKKADKKTVEEKEIKIAEKIDNLNIYDDDLEEMREKEKADNAKKENKGSKTDKIEELFVKDNVELNNFFYVNPYAQQHNDKTEKKEKNKEKDVTYDVKKGKFIVKDIEKEIQESKLAKKRKKEKMYEVQKDDVLGKKRVQNVIKDTNEIDYGSDDEEENPRKKVKVTENHSKKIKHQAGHYVKYSGDEYKNKKGKGDKLIQGKYEPFAYIQLNPKTGKDSKANLKIFQELMKNENK